MTIGEILDLVDSATGRTDKRDLAGAMLKLGIKEISRAHDWNALRSELTIPLSADQYEVTFPTRTIRAMEVRLINSSSLALSIPFFVHPKALVLSYWPNISLVNSGVPTVGYLEGNKLTIVPPCISADYSIKATLVMEPAEYTSESETFPIPGLENAAVEYVVWKVFMSVQRYQDGAMHYGEYLRARKLSERDDDRNPVQRNDAQPFVAHLRPQTPTPWYDPFQKKVE